METVQATGSQSPVLQIYSELRKESQTKPMKGRLMGGAMEHLSWGPDLQIDSELKKENQTKLSKGRLMGG
jgi:hypothetical protein